MLLPPARQPGRYPIALVCLGNICRSPMADVVLAHRLDEAGLGDVVLVRSAGTGSWHVGNPMDPRAAATLSAAGHDPTRHRAQQYDASWWPGLDLVLAMDADNLSTLADLVPALTEQENARLRLYGDLDPCTPGAHVPDPYYGGDDGFREVLQMVERTTGALVAALADQRPWDEPPR
ncbi:MAG: low molecular weight phosphotyrosine protein phosphatase [Nocardioides sp.]|nr:low molecular weight phosphotyrosine protein phosphatase [Nocardioides sp.]